MNVESLMALADEYAASCSNGNTLGDNPLRAALREALAQPDAEPVAFHDKDQPQGIAWCPGYPDKLRDITALYPQTAQPAAEPSDVRKDAER